MYKNNRLDIGRMNKRITIQKYTTYQNDNGFDVEDWIPYKTAWASINNLWGKEFYAAKQVNMENTVEFVCRYSRDLTNINTKEYRIFWNNRVFDITFVDNIQYANKWLKIKAIEVI